MNLPPPQPRTWHLFGIWASIGFQSFGGGSSAQFLIQRAFIDQYGWLTAEEYLHLWGLCLLTPGINLIALTILIGRKCGGKRGIVASLAGLLVPSALITCLLAALYQQIATIPAVQAVLRGIVPATAGVMLLVALDFARPLLRRGYRGGARALGASIVLTLMCALAIIVFRLPVIAIVIGALLLGALAFPPQAPVPLGDEEVTAPR